MRRIVFLTSVVGLATLVLPSPALAQFDITGSYNALFHEDQPERIPGPSLGDYLGLPINDSARAFAEAWDASRLTVPEHQCRAHSSPYILRGPLNMRIWDERDRETQQIVAIHLDISNFQQRRMVWMDGRPHPSKLAEHTWMGFSTGRWEGDALVVTTTHIKQMWHRRNGVPQSDQVTLTERFALHGTVMTYVTITDDPGVSHRAAREDHQHAAEPPPAAPATAALSLLGGRGDRRSAARRRAALPAGREPVPQGVRRRQKLPRRPRAAAPPRCTPSFRGAPEGLHSAVLAGPVANLSKLNVRASS